jgi:hypothetical protein
MRAAQRSIVILGLPGSGKTTFLAALWHLVTARDIDTVLRFHSLRDGDVSHLNALAKRWRLARRQRRTVLGEEQVVSMNLLGASEMPVRLTFPDLSGEAFRHIWEDRSCDPTVSEILTEGDTVLLFVHADAIDLPLWVVDITAQSHKIGLPVEEGPVVDWHPRLAPTQVQLVDLLQLLRQPPLDRGPRRLAVMLSAWDKVVAEGLVPEAYLRKKLPLLDQYLRQKADGWMWRVYGLSAQGGEYDDDTEVLAEAEELRAIDRPSTRIQLVDYDRISHDLTDPVAWLMG